MKNTVFALALSVTLAMSPLCALANDAAVQTLDVKTAIEQAITNSSKLKSLENSDKSAYDKLAASARKVSQSQGSTASAVLDYEQTLMETKLQEAINTTDKTKQRELIKQSVYQYFAAIINAENDLAAKRFEVQAAENLQQINIVKRKHDLISAIDFTTAQNSYNALKAELLVCENTLNDAYITLNKLTGADTEARYTLTLDAPFAKLGNIDMAAHIQRAISNDTEIKNLSLSAETANFNAKNYVIKNTNETTGEYTIGATTEEGYLRTASGLKNDITDRSKTIEANVVSSYNSIIEAENSYAAAVLELKALQQQKQINDIALKVGNISKSSYDEFTLKLMKQENTVKSMEYSHFVDVMKFKSEYTAGS